MALLPCLRRGSDRWWLPRSSVAIEVVGQLLLASGRGHLDPITRQRVIAALRSDPALLIYASLHWPGDHASVAELADWLAEHAMGQFASGDAFLGVPKIDAAMVQRWARLGDHYRTVPVGRWLEDAALWLEVAGPPVPQSWRQLWPELVDPQDGGSENGDGLDAISTQPAPGDCMLQQLARMVQRQRSLTQSFDTRLHNSKMEALKQLAYGLSHEINNPLANISTRAQQLQRGEEDPSRIATLQRIVDQVYRAHEMISDLMFYANPATATRQRHDLNGIVLSVVEGFTEEAERQSIRLEVKTPEDPMWVVVDRQMIAEALRALIRNSVEAIGCQGTIVVSLVQHPGRVMVHVADSGPGLSDQARQHAFDPYFSGREAGRGLGLGLCRAYRIARLHAGDVTLAGGPAGCVATITLNEDP
jgi:signal transduction histidine kinase